MGFVELLVRLEERFGVSIALDTVDIDHFRSIRAMAEFVRGQSRVRQMS